MDLFLFFTEVICFITLYHCVKKFRWGSVEDQGLRPSENPRGHAISTRQAAICKGLDQTILESLPVVVFSIDQEFKDGLEFYCSVCLSEVVDGEQARLLPECNHGFHVGCIDTWFQSHSTCPLCRNAVSSTLIKSLKAEVEAETEAIAIINSDTILMPRTPSTGSSNIHFSSHQGQADVRSLAVCEGPSYMVINIPIEMETEIFSPVDKYGWDDAKWPLVLRPLRTLKRLLSREK